MLHKSVLKKLIGVFSPHPLTKLIHTDIQNKSMNYGNALNLFWVILKIEIPQIKLFNR